MKVGPFQIFFPFDSYMELNSTNSLAVVFGVFCCFCCCFGFCMSVCAACCLFVIVFFFFLCFSGSCFFWKWIVCSWAYSFCLCEKLFTPLVFVRKTDDLPEISCPVWNTRYHRLMSASLQYVNATKLSNEWLMRVWYWCCQHQGRLSIVSQEPEACYCCKCVYCHETERRLWVCCGIYWLPVRCVGVRISWEDCWQWKENEGYHWKWEDKTWERLSHTF